MDNVEITRVRKGESEYYILDTEKMLGGILIVVKNAQCSLITQYISLDIYGGINKAIKAIKLNSFKSCIRGKGGVEGDGEEEFVEHKGAKAELDKIKKYDKPDHEDYGKWTASTFEQYIQKKFKNTYGVDSFEFTKVNGQFYSGSAKGRIWTLIKQRLINVFESAGMNKEDLKNYIDWAYDKRSGDMNFPINLGLLSKQDFMTEWKYEMMGKKTTAKPTRDRQRRLIR